MENEKNEKLIALMKLKGISKKQLSELTNISGSTLQRIINGQIQKVKMNYMEAIAKVLGTSIYTIFDLPAETPLSIASALRPEDAGASITKLLNPDESLLLYWYQNAYPEGRAAILNRAKAEYYLTQKELTGKLSQFNHVDDRAEKTIEFQQIKLPL